MLNYLGEHILMSAVYFEMPPQIGGVNGWRESERCVNVWYSKCSEIAVDVHYKILQLHFMLEIFHNGMLETKNNADDV